MYSVTGSNLFGQWLLDIPILVGFQNISVSEKANLSVDPAKVKLLHNTWSYNLFHIEKNFYLSGSWRGEENQFIKLDLPEECKVNPESNLTLVGNDYNLMLVDQDTHTIWMINLENENEVKKLSLNIDTPIKPSPHKRKRLNDKITKTVAVNNSCLYLTADGNVYSGLLPSHLDTSHCTGKVCDIACGYEHFILLTDAGRVYTWGNGRRLQLGHGDLTNLDIPTEVDALAGLKIVKISAGGWHSLALSEFGDLYSWGWNDTGQLGVKSLPDSSQGVLKTEGLKSYPLPTLVDILDENDQTIDTNVKDIACGSRHSTIILQDNTVWTSGCNKYGQLGFPPETQPTVDYFKKAFECKYDSSLQCGPWSTVLTRR